MIKVLVYKQARYPVSSFAIKKKLASFLRENGVASDTYVSVALVNKTIMLDLAKKFLKEESLLHNVLSFTESEVSPKFSFPSLGAINLGEIVVCFPKAREEAKEENKMLEEKVMELIFHGAKHLLGVHH